MAVFGITGWSGSGKTSLIEHLIPLLSARGFVVGVLKHAHHNFSVDQEGKDSHRFRLAGSRQTAISSARRWALMSELGEDEAEMDVFALLEKFQPQCNLVLVEGYKNAPLPKIEVWRKITGKTPIALQNPHVVAVATDGDAPELPPHCALLPLNAPAKIADFIAANAK